MKAVVFEEFGGPEKLKEKALPDPKCGPNDVLVKIEACALNHLDIWVREGIPGVKIEMPHIGGSDICGEIVEIGSSVRERKIGERVIVSPGIGCRVCEYCLAGKESLCDQYDIVGFRRNGGYAEKVAVDERDVIPVSNRYSPIEWAAVPLVFLTAWHMLATRARLQAGEAVLIHAAGSGIGSAAIQIAKYLGANVIATAGSSTKLQRAKELGVSHLINYQENRHFSKAVMEITGGRGVDVVFEHIGGEVFSESVASLAKEGRIVFCGATTSDTANFLLRQAYLRHLTFHGSFMGGRGELLHVLRLIEDGKLKPVVDSVFPLSQACQAQEKMLSRNLFGKIVLKI
jgi:NADPH:quinone reductase-like Zn-dependent oxidoreductase